ncbi:hypothetical protein [Granulicoccus phenolivorans]|uniref:hypothetical protein n=1 Tax=Granulicoccus phenolivorans TaxID=266854 RepID=UPI0004066C07|nr:hypothetical protein [Granulicoccus phenolivorans]
MSTNHRWDSMQVALQGPGVEIRRADDAGLAQCLIRLAAGTRTDELFAGLPEDQCQSAHWGYIVSGTMRVHSKEGAQDYLAGELYYWSAGHNLEAVTDAVYVEISPSADYDVLMAHCHQVLGS